MDKVRLLCATDGRMMQEFSARTVRRLEDHSLFRLLLPVFRSFFEINVRKEIEKDRLAILRAANVQRAGGTPGAADVEALLQQDARRDAAAALPPRTSTAAPRRPPKTPTNKPKRQPR